MTPEAKAKRYQVGDDARLLGYKLAERDEWRKWQPLIPYIKWPSDWLVKAVPPFGNAIIRYNIKTPKCEFVSVYLDCYDELGFVGVPYWEVYPNSEGDCTRVLLSEPVENLLNAISECGEK